MKPCCEIPEDNNKTIGYKIALVGNPNSGKSLIFNQLTGSHQKVANYPGITLTKKEGYFEVNKKSFTVVDLPGTYGLITNKIEDKTVHAELLQGNIDLIINIIDGTKLENGLFLTSQLLELGKKMIVLINFKDKFEKRGITINLKKLEELLGLHVYSISALERKKIKELKQILDFESDFPQKLGKHLKFSNYDPLIEEVASSYSVIGLETTEKSPYLISPKRWLILSSLMIESTDTYIWPNWIIRSIHEKFSEKLLIDENGVPEKLGIQILNEQYKGIQKITDEVITIDSSMNDKKHEIAEKLDNVLLNKFLGIPIFIFVMFILFYLTFFLTNPITQYLEFLTTISGNFVKHTINNEFLASFLADGIIGGIGFVFVFIPQIAVLFILLSFLEHSGYLARVVFITDSFLSKIGISGTSLAPMLLGFGCNVPAILSTKNIEDPKEKIAIILANPFLSCSARFPVYVLFASALFGKSAAVYITIVYVTGIIISITLILIFRKTFLKGYSKDLFLELPDLSIPSLYNVFWNVYTQIKRFIYNAMTWMGGGILIMWLLSITGPSGYLTPKALTDTNLMKSSWVFVIGNYISPIFKAFGWDNRVVVALIFGFIAKEVVVGAIGLIYGTNGSELTLRNQILNQFTPISGFGFMIFVLSYTPCIGTFSTIKHEIGLKWALFSVILSLGIAYTLTFGIIMIGNLIY